MFENLFFIKDLRYSKLTTSLHKWNNGIMNESWVNQFTAKQMVRENTEIFSKNSTENDNLELNLIDKTINSY